MSRYRLWLDRFSDVFNYEMKYLTLSKALQKDPLVARKYKMCECLKFVVDHEVRDKFTLMEIDSLLAGYESEEEFLRAFFHITKKNYKKDISSYHLLVTYKQNSDLKELDLVYDSPLLQKYALLERGKKKSSKILKDTPELEQFCTKLFRLVENEKTREYVFSPFSAFLKLDYMDAKKLAKYIPCSKSVTERNPLYESLEKYTKYYDRKREKEDSFLPTSQESEALIEEQKQIYRILRSSYTTLRNTVLFMQTVEDIHKKETLSSATTIDGQLMFVAGEENSLHLFDPISFKNYQEYLNDVEENETILEKLAYEKEMEFKRKYESDEQGILDDYGFEEKEVFSKSKGMTS